MVGAEGSATSINNRLRTNGPNFNIRKENVQQVLYAIRNGGFSGVIMPENIVRRRRRAGSGQLPRPVLGAQSAEDGRPSRSNFPPSRTPAAAGVLDLKRIREDPDGVRAALAQARRGGRPTGSLAVLELDARRRQLLPELEGLRAEQNEANVRIRAAPDANASASARSRRCARSRRASRSSSDELADVEPQLQDCARRLPNLPDPSAAPGPEDELVREVGSVSRCRSRRATTSSWPGR